MLSDFVVRGAGARKVNRWMVQPGQIIYVTWWDVLGKAATMLGTCVLVAGLVLACVMGFSGL